VVRPGLPPKCLSGSRCLVSTKLLMLSAIMDVSEGPIVTLTEGVGIAADDNGTES
jgi:hypothetical protein